MKENKRWFLAGTVGAIFALCVLGFMAESVNFDTGFFNIVGKRIQLSVNVPLLSTTNTWTAPVTFRWPRNGTIFFFDPENNAYGILETNGYEHVWTNGLEYVIGATNTMWIGNIRATTNITSGTYNSSGYTVANLPTGQATGTRVFCTDCVTPDANPGAWVTYDGTNWRIDEYGIKVTTDIPTFGLNCVERGKSFSTRVCDFQIAPEEVSVLSLPFYAAGNNSGTGSGSGVLAFDSVYGAFAGFQSAASPGYTYRYGVNVTAIQANWYYASGGNLYQTALATTAEQVWTWYGLSSVNSQLYPVEGAFLVHDMWTNNNSVNVFINGLVGAAKTATNNWLACVAHASAYTYADTGIPVTTTRATPNQMKVMLTNGAALFFSGTTRVATLTGANLPTTALYLNGASQVKTVGSTARHLGENGVWRFQYHPARP